MQYIFTLVALFLVSPFTFAQNEHRGMVSGAVGFFGSEAGVVTEDDSSATASLSGMMGLGAEYEYFCHKDVSVGGLFRYYNTSDDIGRMDYTDKAVTVGAIARAHVFDTQHWMGTLTTGLGLTQASIKSENKNNGNSSTVESDMAFSLYLGIGMAYKMDERLSIGVENLRVLGLGERINGWIISDFMFKVGYVL